MKKEFCHLHTHTEYSLLDGANRIAPLVREVAKDKQKALAITDHGNMHGALKFYNECKANDIKPIIGCEFYVSMGDRFRKHTRENGYNHLTLLARDAVGYKNLLRLTSLSFIDGLSYRPRIDHDLIAKYAQGITCLSGCLSGKVNRYILQGKEKAAQELAAEFQDIFGKNHFWIEVQRNGLQIQNRANESIVSIAKHIGAPVCATNDIHYQRAEDCDFQDTLLCVNTGSRKQDPNRFKFETNHLYVKTREQMIHLFKDMEDAVYQTNVVAEQVSLEIEQGNVIFPEYDLKGKTAQELLIEQTYFGLAQRYECVTPEIQTRANYELRVIESMGYPEYFLIVQDFIQHAKSKGIPVGPGRGSAAGCIVSYALGITDIDPIKHKLLFERFLNPDRVGLPDIDVDFCKNRRNEVLDYLKDKHGDDRVAQIATFGTFGAKAAIRDAARVLEVPIKDTDIIAKRMEGDSIQECIDKDPALSKAEQTWPDLFKTARKLEGMVKFSGTHACGVVLGNRPLYEILPLGRNTIRKRESVIVTQWDLDDCEKIGLVKFDMLGLETLTIIENCQKLIEERTGSRVDLFKIDMEDLEMYQALGKGDSEGVFQCYSDAAKRLLVEMKPDCFDDLIAVIALNRPGPLESGIAKQFIDRKHGREAVEYLHPDLKAHLSETYGCMIYQEQIMQIAVSLAGFSMSDADGLRKAVGKKNLELLNSIKESWVKGCSNLKKITNDQALNLWEDILKFGRYGFNLSHSASYAYLTAWTAYLRTHFKVEFLAANMTQELEDKDRLSALIRDADRHDIKILPPSITESGWEFSVVNNNTIRMGIGCVKGIGRDFSEMILNIKWPKDKKLLTTLKAIPQKALKRNTLTALIRSGMLDFTNISRGSMMAKVDDILKLLRKKPKVYENSLFGDLTPKDDPIEFSVEDEWSYVEKLREERLAYGYYISGHPMAHRKALVWNSGARPVSYIQNSGVNTIIYNVGGIIVESNVKAVKSGKNKGKKYARLLLEDSKASINCAVFTGRFENLADIIREAVEEATPVVVSGRLDTTSEERQIVVNKIELMRPNLNSETFEFDIDYKENIDIAKLAEVFSRYPGNNQLYINIKYRHKTLSSIKTQLKIEITEHLIVELEKMIS